MCIGLKDNVHRPEGQTIKLKTTNYFPHNNKLIYNKFKKNIIFI